VLRLAPGDAVECADAAGRVFRASLRAEGRVALLELVDAAPAVGPTVWIALAGGRADTAVEKLTELGAAAIGALQAERGRGTPRLDRWSRVAEAAVKQARRAARPALLGPSPFADVVRTPGAVVLDHEAADAVPFSARRTSTLLIGPEAGWSDAERALARAAGVPLARLGDGVVLRSETAAVAAAALAVFGGR
jgi:16S rRNA (uracil1498-N3)-methyltransferase